MANYDDTLNFLRSLLTTKQTNNQSNFNSGLGLETTALGNQNNQANARIALQKALQDWQQQLGNRQQNQSEQEQQFGQQQEQYHSSLPYLNLLSVLGTPKSATPSPSVSWGGRFGAGGGSLTNPQTLLDYTRWQNS